jgi:hypothetical protein
MKYNNPLFNVLIFSVLTMSLYGQVTLTQSNLPIITINSNGNISDEPKVSANIKVYNKGLGQINKLTDNPQYSGRIGIETRGSTSQGFPKQPYGFETWDAGNNDIDTTLLGMPSESDWVLNAAFNDKTLMRDVLAYHWGDTIMKYAPKSRYCELIINGEYKGIYVLMEKIKRSKNRVKIDKLDNTISSGDELTGGYIVKMDKETGNVSTSTWLSTYPAIPNTDRITIFQLEYPNDKNVNSPQINYIKSHIRKVEDVINSPQFADPVNGWRKYIDEGELMDFIIINELCKNVDGYRLSTYFYKERDSKGGKIKMGPLWDFNLSMGNADYCTGGGTDGLVITDFNKVCGGDYWTVHFWWEKFLQDKKFYDDLKKRWRTLRNERFSTDNLLMTIDSIHNYLKPAIGRNFTRWPILGQYVWPNSFIGNTYEDEINFIRNWTRDRAAYLDIVWRIDTNSKDFDGNTRYTLYPNPSTQSAVLELPYSLVQITMGPYVFDSVGRSFNMNFEQAGEQSYLIETRGIASGYYIIRWMTKDGNIHSIPMTKE